jgi:hypothetical protein
LGLAWVEVHTPTHTQGLPPGTPLPSPTCTPLQACMALKPGQLGGASSRHLGLHALLLWMYAGPPPEEGLEVGHLCHHASCLCPWHFAYISRAENVRQAHAKKRQRHVSQAGWAGAAGWHWGVLGEVVVGLMYTREFDGLQAPGVPAPPSQSGRHSGSASWSNGGGSGVGWGGVGRGVQVTVGGRPPGCWQALARGNRLQLVLHDSDGR